jgi:hypothetical protein
MVPTGDELAALSWEFVYKPANTDRPSTTTFADDPDLTIQLEANSTYYIRMAIKYAALSAAAIKTQWTVPAGATGSRSAVGPGTGVTLDADSGGTGRWGIHNYPTTVVYGTRNSATNLCSATEESTIFTTSAGTLALTWAQNASNATATRVAAGSTMLILKLA